MNSSGPLTKGPQRSAPEGGWAVVKANISISSGWAWGDVAHPREPTVVRSTRAGPWSLADTLGGSGLMAGLAGG